jgi:hypothetical protein
MGQRFVFWVPETAPAKEARNFRVRVMVQAKEFLQLSRFLGLGEKSSVS